MAYSDPETKERERAEDALMLFLNRLMRLEESEFHDLRQLLTDFVDARAKYHATQALDPALGADS